MGGVDASLSYAIRPTTRVVRACTSFSTGRTASTAARHRSTFGFQKSGRVCRLERRERVRTGRRQNLNVRTKDTFGIFMVQKLFLIKGMPGGHVLPIVISPTYVARGGKIGESVNNNDVVPFAYHPPNGPFFTDVPTRTAQFESLAVTLPFLKTPKMFGTFTVAPEWLVHTAGVNSNNHMQIPQILYLEYTPSPTRRFSSSRRARATICRPIRIRSTSSRISRSVAALRQVRVRATGAQ